MISTLCLARAAPMALAAALAALLLAHPANGQTPAPAPGPEASTSAAPVPAPAPAPAVVLPKLNCGPRPEHPGRDASETKERQWRKDASAYLECYKRYAMEQRTLAQQYQDAANAVIDEYNAVVKEMQAAADAAAPSN